VNYAGTQVNVWGLPDENYNNEYSVDPYRNPQYNREQMLEVNFSFERMTLV
jgi:hypothetical protein